MASVQTQPYKTLADGQALLLDIYSPSESLKSTRDITPVMLYFHAGGLTSYNRATVFPHVVQACLSREWTLVSADYRLLPQATGQDLLEDFKDAYEFVVAKLPGLLHNSSASRGREASRKARRIILAGGSAGAFLPFLGAYNFRELSPPPIAILSYYGIPSFKDAFFNTSHVIGGGPGMTRKQVAHLLDDKEIRTGTKRPSDDFDLSCLTDDLSRNPAYVKPAAPAEEESGQPITPEYLYDYFLQENTYPEIFKDMEIDFEKESGEGDWEKFPKIVMLHGDDDIDVPIEIASRYEAVVKKALGDGVIRLVVVEGAGHCFDGKLFWEDETKEMQRLKEVWRLLDEAVDDGKFSQ